MKEKWTTRIVGRANHLLPLVGAAGVGIWTIGTLRWFGLGEFVAAQTAQLGAGVISGGVVTLAVVALQRKNDLLAEEREQQLREDLERRQFAMSLSLQADLSGITLTGLDLRGLVLSRKKLVGAVLRKCDLRGVMLDGADLSDADLVDAVLDDADLRGAVLTRSDLVNARLRRADLRGADLSGADLSRADLSAANLTGTSLAGARVDHTVVERALLANADLSGVDPRQLLGAMEAIEDGDRA